MKNNKGFISMSLVYSFLIVFVTISASLLAIYTENISDIRRLNTEIKDDLIERGNDQVIVLENLVKNGTFDQTSGTGNADNWVSSRAANCRFSKKGVVVEEDPTTGETHNYQTGQSYYGDGSLEVFTNTNNTACRFVSTSPIVMKQGHIYYIEFTFMSGQGYGIGNNDVNAYFVRNYETAPTNANYVSVAGISKDKPFMTGWTMPSGEDPNFNMGSISAGIFSFNQTTTNAGTDYYIGLSFSDETRDQPTYIDGLMLIDITQAVGDAKAAELCGTVQDGTRCSNSDTTAARIWRLKAVKINNGGTIQYTTEGFYDGRKVFSAFDPFTIK